MTRVATDQNRKTFDVAGATRMRQTAAYPELLDQLVHTCKYKGWTFVLTDIDRGQLSEGLTLDIITLTANSYHPRRCEYCSSTVTNYRVHHYMPVPPAAYDIRSWKRWLFDQILLVERHEAAEFFQVGDDRPYAPSHGPGNDPYILREIGTPLDVATAFTGAVNS
jgi:hypothetical protein